MDLMGNGVVISSESEAGVMRWSSGRKVSGETY